MYQEFDNDVFKADYRRAYDCITPDKKAVSKIQEKIEERKQRKGRLFVAFLRPVATAACVMLLLSVTVLPVMAKNVPGIYNIIARYAPALADFVLPEETSDTSAGITMQVEAVQVEGQTAEIIVSFSDAEGSNHDYIKGKVDMYDSYHLRSYGAVSNLGGCSFLEYDAAEDKAYFNVDVSGEDNFSKGKLTFSVHQLLTECVKEKREIAMDRLVRNPATKEVTLNGLGGSENRELFEQYLGAATDDSPRYSARVLDLQKADASMIEALTITGIGYADGILRLQFCRGNFSEADRHMQSFLVDEEGNERHADMSVGWQEEVEGERLLFDEHWFAVEESELEKQQLYGIFYITGGSVKGDWSVTLNIE